MTALLEIKQAIRKFYIKNEVYITYLWKFLLALISIAVINNKLGYMSSLNNIAIVLMASLLCAILPANFIVFIAAVFIIGHLFALAPECAVIALIVFALMFLLYFRFSPKDTLAVLLTPLLFFLHGRVGVLLWRYVIPNEIIRDHGRIVKQVKKNALG